MILQAAEEAVPDANDLADIRVRYRRLLAMNKNDYEDEGPAPL
jgi:hypothetical protein